ncbi:MAG: hypothetical protein M3P28_03835 [Thermoproteota archaeon]|nr:hypothetical protein [Thermoproteota archaeon]
MKNTKLTINTDEARAGSIITQHAISHFITDTEYDPGFGPLCEIEKEHRVKKLINASGIRAVLDNGRK